MRHVVAGNRRHLGVGSPAGITKRGIRLTQYGVLMSLMAPFTGSSVHFDQKDP